MTSKQVERWLNSPNWNVRCNWARRMDYTPTPEQIQRGLNDEHRLVREAWARRTDYTPNQEQIQRGMKDEYWMVRYTWANRTDYTPTQEQIQRGLDDEHWLSREAWAKRMDYTPTPEQIQRGLDDVDKDVRCAWAERIARMDGDVAMNKQTTDVNVIPMLLADFLVTTVTAERNLVAAILANLDTIPAVQLVCMLEAIGKVQEVRGSLELLLSEERP